MESGESKEQKKQIQDQTKVKTCIFCAVIFMLAYVVTATYIPFPRLHLPNFIDRVVFTLRWLMVSLLATYAGVIAVGNKRFATAAINPLDPSGKQFTELRQQYLQNTVEQFLLHSFRNNCGGFFDPRPFTLDPRLVTLDPRPFTLDPRPKGKLARNTCHRRTS